MKRVRQISCVLLLLIVGASFAAELLASANYATQFRDELPNAAPSRQHLLGTDDLGRDRFSRVLFGTRVSLLLAPAAALLSTLLAAVVGALAGYIGGRWEKLAMASADLFLSLPWLFLLLMVRAMLPLNVSPFTSVMVTFLLLGLLGWAASARVLCAGARSIRNSDFVLLARASGIGRLRVLFRHVLPNLKPVLLAQFWISIPVFILSEANLGILGLGVAEPLPSWGSLLRELENFANFGGEYWRLVPLVLLVITVTSFQLVLSRTDEVSA
ncbi:MAG TPA: ABC transporter permease [Terriglobales bacterium]|nr:ABC transporter permease [Terriglobales bacterium]